MNEKDPDLQNSEQIAIFQINFIRTTPGAVAAEYRDVPQRHYVLNVTTCTCIYTIIHFWLDTQIQILT